MMHLPPQRQAHLMYDPFGSVAEAMFRFFLQSREKPFDPRLNVFRRTLQLLFEVVSESLRMADETTQCLLLVAREHLRGLLARSIERHTRIMSQCL